MSINDLVTFPSSYGHSLTGQIQSIHTATLKILIPDPTKTNPVNATTDNSTADNNTADQKNLYHHKVWKVSKSICRYASSEETIMFNRVMLKCKPEGNTVTIDKSLKTNSKVTFYTSLSEKKIEDNVGLNGIIQSLGNKNAKVLVKNGKTSTIWVVNRFLIVCAPSETESAVKRRKAPSSSFSPSSSSKSSAKGVTKGGNITRSGNSATRSVSNDDEGGMTNCLNCDCEIQSALKYCESCKESGVTSDAGLIWKRKREVSVCE